MRYAEFLDSRRHKTEMHGFSPVFYVEKLMPFQRALVDWSVEKGRCAIFADCGLGKTLIQLVWAQNIVKKTNGRVLILTPLAVGAQTLREAERFGISAARSRDGTLSGEKIIVTNYEKLHLFNPADFAGCVCDESSILKNFDGMYKAQITEFMRCLSYRLLCTATAAPNDYVELGTSSEALGEMGFMDMLGRFFKNDTNPTVDTKRRFAAAGGDVPKWRFKFHAEIPFWQWICSWARAVRKPSDLGFQDGKYILPDLAVNEHCIKISRAAPGQLFAMPAACLKEERDERKQTITERCEMAAGLAKSHNSSVLWCHLNEEGKLLEKLMGSDCVQVCGSQSDEKKEEMLGAFLSGQAKYLVTKPMCAGFGLNMQHCAHMTFFPSHSYEQYYQSVRRCWRFGQTRPVTVDIVTTEGESRVLSNLQRKSAAADSMFSKLVEQMNNSLSVSTKRVFSNKEEIPSWLAPIN
jgi:hypothetical protein